METIEKVFNEGAQTYDKNRKKLIPCFDKFYSTALSLIDKNFDSPIKVLDLGAGTGFMSYFILSQYPNAEVTLIDLSEKMLEKAKERLAKWSGKIQVIVDNYCDYDFTEKYDVIISSLSIHHLEDAEKEALFKKIYAGLKPGGQFINADQVLGETSNIEAMYREHWLKEVKNSGISEEELCKALERMKEDRMSTLDDQLTWLKAAGFQDVNCWFKDYSFVVYSGKIT